MLKYLYTKELFSEVPGEITLGISISGCKIHCEGCHSKELWEDKGIPLTTHTMKELLKHHKGITCVCLLGGEHDIDSLIELFMYAHKFVKTAWYCGLDELPKEKQSIIRFLDYIKLGHYDMKLGGLDSSTTNQRFYRLEHQVENVWWDDITPLFYLKSQKH